MNKATLGERYPEKVLFSSSFDGDFKKSCDGPIKLSLRPGPDDVWIGRPNTGISGAHTLCAEGHARIEKASVTLFDALSVKVSEDTVFTYHIFPCFTGEHYDFTYCQMYFALALYFEDGSRASLTDQNGNALTPLAQGESRTLYTHQWNQLYASVGKYAGKVIDKIVLEYEMPNGKREFCTYFDDLSIVDQKATVKTRPCHYATIFRGTNDSPAFSHGLTTPAVTMPQGFSMYGPLNIPENSKHYAWLSDNIMAMTVSHEPSIWIGERGSWQFMVNTSKDASAEDLLTKHLRNKFSHKNEIGHPHYYAVSFGEDGGDAAHSSLEMTPTCHGVAVRFKYGSAAKHHSVIFDNQIADAQVTFGDDGSFVAYSEHRSNGSGRLFIYGRFDKLPIATGSKGRSAIAVFDTDEVNLQFATSYIDHEQAKHNLELELAGKSFDTLAAEAADAWDEIFSHISDIKGAREEEIENIYSGLYYLYKYPNLMSENVGSAEAPVWKYRSPYSGKVEDGVIYINNGFWDTYRTAWAGYSLFTPEKMPELLNGFIRHYHDQGWIPRWSAPGGVNCMVGTSIDVIFADALVKGFDFDIEAAYRSSIKDGAVYPNNPTNGGRTKMERSVFLGYTPGSHEDFSWSIEGYINDYGIAQMAKILAERETDADKKANYLADHAYYLHRAMNYTRLFCDGEGVENKWFRGKEANGEWTKGNMHEGKFDPLFWGNDYTETDAHNMTVSVVHDGKGLANLYGGPAAMARKMDAIFETNDVNRGYGATDERGGIHEQREAREVKLGRFGISNQPSHHIIYMYNHTTDHYKTQKYIRDCTKRLFVGARFGQGFPGDEDNGEMSCWYLFSCLGFYPVCIGSGEYTIGSPAFSDITVHFADKSLRVIAHNNSDENVYIQSALFNGKPLNRCVITHDEIKEGGVLEFVMGNMPSEWAKGTAPVSVTVGEEPAKPWRDLVCPKAVFRKTDVFSTEPVKQYTVASNVGTLRAAFDNNSKTEAVLDPCGTTVVFSSCGAKKVSCITLTSPAAENTVIDSMQVYGANDNGEWVSLGRFTDLVFEWGQYTRPFLLKDAAPYQHYMLVLTGASSVAEIELLGE